MHRLMLISFAFLLATQTSIAQSAIILGPEAEAAGLTLTQVATNLDFPMGMTPLPDGSLLVATNPSSDGVFYTSDGQLLRLFDSDGDGSLDQETPLAEDLPGGLVAVVRFGEIVAATSSEYGNEQIMFFRRGDRWRDPLTQIDDIRLNFINSGHQSYGLAVRPNPDDPDQFDLFFNIGAAGNDTAGPDVQTSGAIDDVLTTASVYMVTIRDTGDVLTFSDTTLIATGLRNGTTMAIQPGTGDLWIGENGIDGLDDPNISFSADELNIVPAAQIGKDVIDFGFPDAYIDYTTGDSVGPETQFVAFLPTSDGKSEGVAGITFAPGSFPEPFAGGVLAGFHGRFDETGLTNTENPLLWINPATGEILVIVSNDSEGIGHLDSMVAVGDTVYIADFCDASMVGAINGCGSIYAIRNTDYE